MRGGTVEAAYAYFGLPFSGVAADAIRGYLGANRARSAHRYALGDFGLTAADVGARFGAQPQCRGAAIIGW